MHYYIIQYLHIFILKFERKHIGMHLHKNYLKYKYQPVLLVVTPMPSVALKHFIQNAIVGLQN